MSADHPGAAAPRPSVPDCHAGVCVTCSDQALPFRVRSLLGDGLALADTGDGVEEISVALVEAAVGDLVLVHAGEAIARVEEEGVGDESR